MNYAISTFRCLIPWSGVDFVFFDKGTMHFVTGLTTYYLPARCFADEAQRQATFDYALARVTPEARQRSSR